MLIVGLTGGIGSGKSTVTALFEKHAVPVIDADIIARQVTRPGQAALKQISQTFGLSVLTGRGELDRQALRKVIFSQADKRQALEAILHPIILNKMFAQAEKLDAPYCLFAIPLLFETGQNKVVDRVLVIDAEEDIRRQRIQRRDGLSAKEIDAVIKAQIKPQERLRQADDIITNNADLNTLANQINSIHQHYNRLAEIQSGSPKHGKKR